MQRCQSVQIAVDERQFAQIAPRARIARQLVERPTAAQIDRLADDTGRQHGRCGTLGQLRALGARLGALRAEPARRVVEHEPLKVRCTAQPFEQKRRARRRKVVLADVELPQRLRAAGHVAEQRHARVGQTILVELDCHHRALIAVEDRPQERQIDVGERAVLEDHFAQHAEPIGAWK